MIDGDNTDPTWIIEEGVPANALTAKHRVPFRNLKNDPEPVPPMDHVACRLDDDLPLWFRRSGRSRRGHVAL
jgi:hypothetical protein